MSINPRTGEAPEGVTLFATMPSYRTRSTVLWTDTMEHQIIFLNNEKVSFSNNPAKIKSQFDATVSLTSLMLVELLSFFFSVFYFFLIEV